jgi:hypothetical protein
MAVSLFKSGLTPNEFAAQHTNAARLVMQRDLVIVGGEIRHVIIEANPNIPIRIDPSDRVVSNASRS